MNRPTPQWVIDHARDIEDEPQEPCYACAVCVPHSVCTGRAA